VKAITQINSQTVPESVTLIPKKILQQPEVEYPPPYLLGEIISLKMPTELGKKYPLRQRKKHDVREQNPRYWLQQ
jgi:hypothetical protein